jgi:rifampicin phosphotransferase
MPEKNSSCIMPFSSSEATLESAGGKGLHLCEMTAAGLPVPAGFILTTDAYRTFVSDNGLGKIIQAALKLHPHPDASELEEISAQIRQTFTSGRISDVLKQEIISAYSELGGGAVAVRSSATAEDLPDLSFAGQQDTYLNVTTEKILLDRVIDCWSSLWTARAIGYRLRQGVGQDGIALAVVVQQMVQSEISGVLFTANPLTGSRVESVIDATYGLGEALVSGLVEPDHYVVSREGQVLSKTLGKKGISIRAGQKGGVERKDESAAHRQALTDEQIVQLAALGTRVENTFGEPQDIEWAYFGGELYLLQTRPITSLFPLPKGLPVEPLKTLVSFAAVQGLVDPITPIGQSALKQIFAMGSALFGVWTTEEKQTVLYSAGERLWVNFTPVLRNTFGRKAIPYVFEMVEPTIKQAVDQLLDDPRLHPTRKGISPRALLQLASFGLPVAGKVFLNILAPSRRRKLIIDQGERVLAIMQQRAATISGDRYEKLNKQTELLPRIARRYLGRAFKLFVSGVASGMVSWNALRMLTRGAAGDDALRWSGLVLEVTRGMPNNPTTEMDLRLWEMTRSIRKDADATRLMRSSTPVELAQRYLNGDLPKGISDEVTGFLDKYGGRGLCEIDLGRTRWAEDPTHVFEMLVNFFKIENENNAPDAVFARGAVAAGEAIDKLTAFIRQGRGGFIKSRQARFFANRARMLMGLRENPKFFAVRMMWIIHRELKKTGEEFVAAGELERTDDLFFLSFPEIREFAAKTPRDWKGLIAERRIRFEREQQRRQLPRLFLSDGRAFYEGMAEQKDNDGKSITGSPVSPGVVEGKVRVVRDPGKAGLAPGEIMVCPGTDPSWTPLFLVAGGLIMEVGGMMTHGAVVAREYGIPAAVGVDKATLRLKTGMKVRLNGSTGEITLLV